MGPAWRGCQTSSSCEFTLRRAWPGAWTPQSCWECSGKITSLRDCCCPFIAAPLRAFQPTVSVLGMAAAQRPRGRPSRGSSAQPKKIIICSLPTLEELHSSRCLKRAQNIVKEIHHPGHSLFELQPSGRRYTNIKAKTNRLKIAPTPLQSMYSMLLKDECACMCMWSCVLPFYCIYYVVLFGLECVFFMMNKWYQQRLLFFIFIIMLFYFVQWQ